MVEQTGSVRGKQMSYLRYLWGMLCFLLLTVFLASVVMFASWFSFKIAKFFEHLWAVTALLFGNVRVETSGLENLDKSKRYVFVSNHQSAIDIPILMKGIGMPLAFIAKKELFSIPFMGWGMRAAGHVWIDRINARKARISMTEAVNRIRKKSVSLVIFPEGTRTVDGNVQEFKRGAFTLAIESGVEVVPVAIKGANILMPKKKPFPTPGTVTVRVGKPVDTSKMVKADKQELSELVRRQVVEMVGTPSK